MTLVLPILWAAGTIWSVLGAWSLKRLGVPLPALWRLAASSVATWPLEALGAVALAADLRLDRRR